MDIDGLDGQNTQQQIALSLDQWQDQQWLALDLIKSFGLDAAQAVNACDRAALKFTFARVLCDLFGLSSCAVLIVSDDPADSPAINSIVDSELRAAYTELSMSGNLRRALYDVPPKPRHVGQSRLLVAPLDFNRPTGSHIAALLPEDVSWSGMRARMLEFVLDQANAQFEALALVEGAREDAQNLQQEVEDKEARIAFQTSHDSVTGLLARATFLSRLDHMLSQGDCVHVVALNLRGFGRVHQRYGYRQADSLLQDIAERLTAEMALVSDRATLARIADDRFAVALKQHSNSNQNEAVHIAEQLVSNLCSELSIDEDALALNVQVGLAYSPDDASDAHALVNAAEVALDAVDRAVGVKVQAFSNLSKADQQDNTLVLESEIDTGLANNEFALWYQPKLNMVTEQVVGAEALMRWHQPEKGMISPAQFIPAAERSGQIIALGDFALRRACTQISAWRRAGFDPGLVSVNLSPIQVVSPDLPERFHAVLQAECIEASALELEVTETAVSQDIATTTRVIGELHAMGFTISIDDFGTGYSSLLLLRQLPINVIKIDRAFVRDIETNADDLAIVRAVLSMASDLGMKVVAEGVENRVQFEMLRDLGCDQLQGAFASMPMPQPAFEQFVSAWTGFDVNGALGQRP